MDQFTFALALLLTATIAGCSTRGGFRGGDNNFQYGESVVLVGQEPASLGFSPQKKSVVVRSTYRGDLPQTIRYLEGRDYLIDYTKGQIRRTPQSRIPDFHTNLLYGVDDFDHSKFPGFGNSGFFAFVDYRFKSSAPWPRQKSQVEFLVKTRQKLATGQKVKIVAFGDSITAGGDATEPALIFWERWADELRRKYPQTKIEAVNGSTGGDATSQGLDRLQQKVLNEQPDVVLIGFGMNDHNIAAYGTPLEKFEENLRIMIDRIRLETSAEIVLYSTFPPNPKWHYGSKNMSAYALATEKVATEKKCAFAEVYHNWLSISEKKKPEDLLGNNINHPNDFGHWIYFRVLRELGL